MSERNDVTAFKLGVALQLSGLDSEKRQNYARAKLAIEHGANSTAMGYLENYLVACGEVEILKELLDWVLRYPDSCGDLTALLTAVAKHEGIGHE